MYHILHNSIGSYSVHKVLVIIQMPTLIQCMHIETQPEIPSLTSSGLFFFLLYEINAKMFTQYYSFSFLPGMRAK